MAWGLNRWSSIYRFLLFTLYWNNLKKQNILPENESKKVQLYYKYKVHKKLVKTLQTYSSTHAEGHNGLKNVLRAPELALSLCTQHISFHASIATMRLAFVVSCEMSRQLLD